MEAGRSGFEFIPRYKKSVSSVEARDAGPSVSRQLSHAGLAV